MSCRTVNNYSASVNLLVPYGFPLRLELPVKGYQLTSLSSGRLLIRGPGSSRTSIVDSLAYTYVDTVGNKYIVNVPSAAPDYSLIKEGRPYTWSFSGDVDAFRIQGDFKAVYDTGQAQGQPSVVDVSIGALSIEVAFQQGGISPSSLSERTVVYGIASGPLSGHRIVYTDGTMIYYADNTVQDHVEAILGMTYTAASSPGESIIVATNGVITEPSWNFTVPSVLYLGNAGFLTTTPPATGWLVVIGKAVNNTSILLDIGEPIKLLQEN